MGQIRRQQDTALGRQNRSEARKSENKGIVLLGCRATSLNGSKCGEPTVGKFAYCAKHALQQGLTLPPE